MRLRSENCLTNCSSTPTNTLEYLPNLEIPKWFSSPEFMHQKVIRYIANKPIIVDDLAAT
jgi:hypothetical protein